MALAYVFAALGALCIALYYWVIYLDKRQSQM